MSGNDGYWPTARDRRRLDTGYSDPTGEAAVRVERLRSALPPRKSTRRLQGERIWFYRVALAFRLIDDDPTLTWTDLADRFHCGESTLRHWKGEYFDADPAERAAAEARAEADRKRDAGKL